MTRRNRTPRLEALEGRLAPGAGGMGVMVKPHHVALNGEVSGSFHYAFVNSDTANSQGLSGGGSVAPLGQVNASGSLSLPVPITHTRAAGSMTLSNAGGSVTIQLTGSIPKANSPFPRNLTFKIVAATGNDAGDTDRGTATFTEAIIDPLPLNSSDSSAVIGPVYTLTLHSA